MSYSAPLSSDVAPVDIAPLTESYQPTTILTTRIGEKRTDVGNATRFLRRHGQDVRFCHPWQKWLVWRDGIWNVDDTAEVIRRAEDTVKSIYAEAARADDEQTRKALARWATTSETEARIRGMLFFAKARAGIPVLPDELDRNSWLLNCVNRTIDTRTGRQYTQKRADLITKRASVSFDPQATCPLWLAFLQRIMDGNQHLVTFLQRAVGYSLTGDTSEQVLFFLYGTGANGKSTFLDIIRELLGDYAAATPTSTLLSKARDTIPNDIARLKGVRFVSAVETENGRYLAESVLKQLTGDKRISARFMRGEWFDFQPECKLWLATNHKPMIRGTEEGIWRRIRLIPFMVSIPPEEQDKRLFEKLFTELPGILNWALEGCVQWQREGLGLPMEVKTAMAAYRAEMDTLADFIAECCIIAHDATASAKELYTRYTRWCEENGERSERQKAFGMRLAERGFRRVKNSIIIWHGIGVMK
jgi:putative DNA primase/helicase